MSKVVILVKLAASAAVILPLVGYGLVWMKAINSKNSDRRMKLLATLAAVTLLWLCVRFGINSGTSIFDLVVIFTVLWIFAYLLLWPGVLKGLLTYSHKYDSPGANQSSILSVEGMETYFHKGEKADFPLTEILLQPEDEPQNSKK